MGFLRPPSYQRLFQTIHGWLGIFVMPLIIVIGLTGFFLNHSEAISALLPNRDYDESRFDDWPDRQPADAEAAHAIAVAVWPNTRFSASRNARYHERAAFIFDSPRGQVIVAAKTAHYWVKTRFLRKTFDPDGRLLARKVYWGNIITVIHRMGSSGDAPGIWFADIAAISMIIFGLTGIVLFFTSRGRESGRKGEGPKTAPQEPEVEVARSKTPRPQRFTLKD